MRSGKPESPEHAQLVEKAKEIIGPSAIVFPHFGHRSLLTEEVPVVKLSSGRVIEVAGQLGQAYKEPFSIGCSYCQDPITRTSHLLKLGILRFEPGTQPLALVVEDTVSQLPQDPAAFYFNGPLKLPRPKTIERETVVLNGTLQVYDGDTISSIVSSGIEVRFNPLGIFKRGLSLPSSKTYPSSDGTRLKR